MQAMVDEQVRQGNPADPSMFTIDRTINKRRGGFDWAKSALGMIYWTEIMRDKKFHLIPKREKPRCPDSAHRSEATPHEIIQHMLDKGMTVWACMSDESYDDARDRIGYYACRVTQYDADKPYQVHTLYAGWKYAVPIDVATMTEITEAPK